MFELFCWGEVMSLGWGERFEIILILFYVSVEVKSGGIWLRSS